VLGLQQIPKPAGTRQNSGAWYQLGPIQLHLSTEDDVQNEASDRHVCYQIEDTAIAESNLRNSGVEVIPDPRPVAGVKRFYIRDPGGNLIELAIENLRDLEEQIASGWGGQAGPLWKGLGCGIGGP